MNALQRTAAVLIFPAIAWLGTACDQPNEPTEERPTALVGPMAVCNVPSPYPTIQSAVNDFTCTTIEVASGTYNESVTILRALTLLGPNEDISWDGTRGPEAIVTSPGITFLVTPGDGITIDGFTINGSFGIYVQGSSDGTLIENNIVTGGIRALTLDGTLETSASNDVGVLNNHLISNTRSLHVDGPYSNMAVNENQFSGAAAVAGIFFTGGTPPNSIAGFEFKDNVVLHPANMASNISNATVSGNTFNPVLPGDEALLISLQSSTMTENSFEGDDEIACLLLWGSQFGLVPSDHVTISENTFSDCGNPAPNTSNYAIQLSQDVHHIDIKNNEITNGFEGVNTDDTGIWDVTNEIHINFNNITDNTSFGIRNGQSGILDGECNWWGDESGPGLVGPGTGDNVSNNVDFTPWLVAPAPGGPCAGGAPSGKVTGGGQVPVGGGKASFGFNAKSDAGLGSGHLNYLKHASDVHLDCTVDHVTDISPEKAEFEGSCSAKSSANYFRAVVEDNGKSGKTDRFFITYNGITEGGTLRSGNITIHK